MIAAILYRKFAVRPVIVEYMFYKGLVNRVMRWIGGVPIPNFSASSNSLKKKRGDQAINDVAQGLSLGDNFLIYPAGRISQTGMEVVGASSAVKRILEKSDETQVVLVRIKGLWGSRFSRALTGKSPPMFKTMISCAVDTLKNGIFFSPRRAVTVEFVVPGKDFPINGSKMEINRYLENFYNPDAKAEDRILTPPYFWSSKLLEIDFQETKSQTFSMDKVSYKVKEAVVEEIARLSSYDKEKIEEDHDLAKDLSMDSLDAAEILVFLEERFSVSKVQPEELKTVASVIGFASQQIEPTGIEEEKDPVFASWHKQQKREPLSLANENHIASVFLKTCERQQKAMACGDDRAGVLTYGQLRLKALVLAEYLKEIKDQRIGILLPASVAANVVILACQLANKEAVMINWTVGKRHLESVLEISQIRQVISAWAVIDRIENVDFGPLDESFLMLEDIKQELTLKHKLTALYYSKLGANRLIRLLELDKVKETKPAIILFTSGTESLPKAVPLSHKNILSNQQSILDVLPFDENAVLHAILPPFHSFGLTVTGLFPLLAGVRVVFFPDPTDGAKLAKSIDKWKSTVICGAPTFLKGLFKSARDEQIQTIKFVVSGAEKASEDLIAKTESLGALFLEGYGITECSPVLALAHPKDGKEQGVGRAVSSVEFLIVDPESYQPLEDGQRGLILAKGPNVFSGYLNPSLSSPFATINGDQWYITGDLGFLENGFLHLSGRLKRFVKIGGEMVSLPALEEALLKHHDKLAIELSLEGPTLAVVPLEKEGEKTQLILFTTAKVEKEAVNRLLKNLGFSNLCRITDVKEVDTLPLMGTGKIHYRKLQELI